MDTRRRERGSLLVSTLSEEDERLLLEVLRVADRTDRS
jgi:hypothetical protein